MGAPAPPEVARYLAAQQEAWTRAQTVPREPTESGWVSLPSSIPGLPGFHPAMGGRVDGRRGFQGLWKAQTRLHLVAFQFHSCAGSW